MRSVRECKMGASKNMEIYLSFVISNRVFGVLKALKVYKAVPAKFTGLAVSYKVRGSNLAITLQRRPFFSRVAKREKTTTTKSIGFAA